MLQKNNKITYGLFLILTVLFFIIVFKGLKTPQPGDENAYYYMGKLISEGKQPYKDFFFAHPPLQVYLTAFIFLIFGFNIIVLKLIPLISTIVSGFVIFKISRHKFGNYEALVSILLFFFSYGVIFSSVFSFGIEIATMFMLVGIYYLLNKEKYFIAGLFFALAGTTRLLSLVPIFVIFATILVLNKKKFIKLLLGFLIIFLFVNAFFILLSGYEYLNQVYKFHLLKGYATKENFNEYFGTIKLNFIIFASAGLFLFIKDKKPVTLFVLIAFIYLLFLAMLNRLFSFYFVIIFPFLAIISGFNLVSLLNINKFKKWKIIIITVLLIIFIWDLTTNIIFLERIAFTGFERGRDILDFINSTTKDETPLFGDVSVVPLIALMSDRDIAMDFVDTNNEVFISGMRDLRQTLVNLKGKDTVFIVRNKQGLLYFSEVRQFLDENCDFLSKFHDKVEGDYLIHLCK